MQNVRELNLPNNNNVLACDVFMQIHFAPKDPVPESLLLNQLYHVRFEEYDFFCKLIDLHRYRFHQLNDHFTLQACGMFAKQWKEKWLQKYPKTKGYTEMAVYYYQKAK